VTTSWSINMLLSNKATVNGKGDLAMIREQRAIIGETVNIIKTCKSGLIQIEFQGRFYTLPKRNLDFIDPHSD
jgi:hypothetical protein